MDTGDPIFLFVWDEGEELTQAECDYVFPPTEEDEDEETTETEDSMEAWNNGSED